MTEHIGAEALAAIRSLRLEVEEADRDDTVKPTADTLPAWLYQRFAVGHILPFETMGEADWTYWEHEAAAVRRAVARGGFKTAGAAPSVAGQALINYAAGHRTVTADGLAPYLAAVRAEAAAEAVAQRDLARSAAVVLEQDCARLQAELAPYQALNLGDLTGRTSGACANDTHPMWVRQITDARGCGWCRAVEVTTERDEFCNRVDTLTAVAKGNKAHVASMYEDLQEMLRERNEALARVAELERERAKYVGVEPTIAEEMAYLSRCFFAVHQVCDEAEQQAKRWEHPLPVPEWVALVRAAASGERELTSYPPAMPWAALMDTEDLQDFLGDLLDALNSDQPTTRDVLAEVEKTCASHRAIAETQHAHNTAPGPDAEAGEGQ
jgi:hypothetical protein